MSTGGPAFPGTLLDWFAGQALVGLLACPAGSLCSEGNADAAYDYAEAMLAEKARREADHSGDANEMVEDHFRGVTKMVELQAQNRGLVKFAERIAAFPLEEFGWEKRADSQPLHGWNDYTLYVSDIKRARNLVAKAKGVA